MARKRGWTLTLQGQLKKVLPISKVPATVAWHGEKAGNINPSLRYVYKGQTLSKLVGLVDPCVRQLAAEPLCQLSEREGERLLVRPRRRDGGAESDQVAQVLAVLPRLHELADAGQRPAPVEHLGHEREPGQVAVVVQADTPLPAGRRQQAAVLVGADVADGRPRALGELLDAVLPVVRGGRSGLVGHGGSVPTGDNCHIVRCHGSVDLDIS